MSVGELSKSQKIAVSLFPVQRSGELNWAGWSGRGLLLACFLLVTSAVSIVDPRDDLPWWSQFLSIPVFVTMVIWVLVAIKGYRSLRRSRD